MERTKCFERKRSKKKGFETFRQRNTAYGATLESNGVEWSTKGCSSKKAMVQQTVTVYERVESAEAQSEDEIVQKLYMICFVYQVAKL